MRLTGHLVTGGGALASRLRPGNRVLGTLLALAAMSVVLWPGATTEADEGSIRVVSASVASEFPDGIRFKVEASGDNDITSIAVRFRTGQQTRGAYDYLVFEQGQVVDSELLWRTNTAPRYIPPGTLIRYNFEIEDSSGARMDTEPAEFIYEDIRFEWSEVSQGPIAVAYHGPVKKRAETLLEAIIDTLGHMGPLLGADIEAPIRVTMYNNVKEMLEALPPRSASISRELITEGQAFPNIGTLLVLGSGRLARGTASHEVTHILTHRAGDSVFRSVPSWLNEGLAEYGNIDPGFSYDVALEFAVATDRLLPITSANVLPGTSEEVIIFYGQARSIVRFMVASFGVPKMRELMATMKSGRNVDDAIRLTYGLSRLELENRWREAIGAEPYIPPDTSRSRPTPVPWPSVLPYSLTPQPSSATIGDVSSTPTPEPTPTAEPTVTATPVPQPTPSPSPTSVPRVTPAPEESTPPAETGAAATSADEGEAQEAQASGGACSAPRSGEPTAVGISSVALLLGLVGLSVRRRIGL